jgi:secreted trypsin-like serine protease
MRRLLTTLAAACAASGALAAPSQAVVGGHDTSDPAYRGVAEITLGKAFGCTGTLIAPQWVLTAGHCGSPTGEVMAIPVGWPAGLVDVRMGSNKAGQGTLYPVSQVVVEPDYLATTGYDLTLLKLKAAAAGIPTTKVAGASERSIWNAGVLETIVGWGTTSEGGSTPDTLQEAQVPIVADADCGKAYSDFDATTMVCAGYPQGGTDTCQGDSGGPLFAHDATGALKVVGATSYGNGCAEPGYPGVYARVADTALRTWIASVVPEAVGS